MNTPTANERYNETINQELANLAKDTSGRITTTVPQLQVLHPETRLVVYLNAKSKRVWIADREAFRALDQEFFFSLNSYIGGLKKVDYQKYRHCTAVVEAAEYHRAHFTPKAPAEKQGEDSTKQD